MQSIMITGRSVGLSYCRGESAFDQIVSPTFLMGRRIYYKQIARGIDLMLLPIYVTLRAIERSANRSNS